MQAGDVRLLRAVCRARGEQVSDFVRRAVRKELAQLSYLGKRDKKALGLNESNDQGNKWR